MIEWFIFGPPCMGVAKNGNGEAAANPKGRPLGAPALGEFGTPNAARIAKAGEKRNRRNFRVAEITPPHPIVGSLFSFSITV